MRFQLRKSKTKQSKILTLFGVLCAGGLESLSAACVSEQFTAGETCTNFSAVDATISAGTQDANVTLDSPAITGVLTINNNAYVTLTNAGITQLNNQGTITTFRSYILPRIYTDASGNSYHYNGRIDSLIIGGANTDISVENISGWSPTNNRFIISINDEGNQSANSADRGWNAHNQASNTANSEKGVRSDIDNDVAMAGSYSLDATNNSKYAPQHIYIGSNVTVTQVHTGAIGVKLGENGHIGDVYKYSKVILKGTSGDNNADGVTLSSLTSAQQGLKLEDRDGVGFVFMPDATDSFGASILKTLTLIHLRREVLVGEMLDSVTTKTFRSSYYARREAALKALNNKEKKLIKNKKLTKYELAAELADVRIARAKIMDTKSKFEGESYNEEKLFDQIDQIFVPYKGDRDWLLFFVPYSAYSSINDTAKASEFAFGGVLGGQRDLSGGKILGLYLGYEYSYAKANLRTTDATANTHSTHLGINYFMPFLRKSLKEYYMRVNARGGVDLPTFEASVIKINPTNVSFGGEAALGATFFSKTKAQYLSPELNFSYDVFSLLKFDINKQAVGQGNEYYPTHIFHLPQVGLGLKWYRAWGNTFRTSIRGGVKYNILNAQEVTFTTYGVEGRGDIELPNIYGTLDLSGIWAFNQNQQISAGYTGIYFNTGVSSAVMLKWQMWF